MLMGDVVRIELGRAYGQLWWEFIRGLGNWAYRYSSLEESWGTQFMKRLHYEGFLYLL